MMLHAVWFTFPERQLGQILLGLKIWHAMVAYAFQTASFTLYPVEWVMCYHVWYDQVSNSGRLGSAGFRSVSTGNRSISMSDPEGSISSHYLFP